MMYVISVCVISGYFPIFRLTKYFYVMIITLLLVVFLPLMYIILDQNPLVWLLLFILNEASKVRFYDNL